VKGPMMQKDTKPRLLNLNDLEAAVKVMSEAFFMDPL